MKHNRYQFQPWYVKAYRQVCYRPKWFFMAIWYLLSYVFKGMPTGRETRLSNLKLVWSITIGCADRDMKHYYTLDEAIERLK